MERTTVFAAARAPEGARALLPFSVIGLAAVAPLPHAIAISAAIGSALLATALLAGNVIRFRFFAREWIKTIARSRKWVGMSSAVWLLGHGAIAFATVPEPGDRATFALQPQILPGVLAAIVLGALLVTSSARAQRALGMRWKRLHELVWMAAALGFTHGALAAIRFDAEHMPPPWLPALTLGIVVFLGFESAALLCARSSRPWRHAARFGLGLAVALGLAAITSSAAA